MATMVTEGRKFGVASTFLHVERFGQLAHNQKLMGATQAIVNKVLFQTTVNDAKEFAPEFAKEVTVTEYRPEPEYVITPDPFWDLLKKGHANPTLAEYVYKYFWPIPGLIEEFRYRLEQARNNRTALMDQANLYRDYASMSQADERQEGRHNALIRGTHRPLMAGALDKTRAALESMQEIHGEAEEQNIQIKVYHGSLDGIRWRINAINQFFISLMRGHIPLETGSESFAQFLRYSLTYVSEHIYSLSNHREALSDIRSLTDFYCSTRFGDPNEPVIIPALLAYKYWPKEIEQAYIQKMRPVCEKSYQESIANPWNKKYAEFIHISSAEERLQYHLSKLREQLENNQILLDIGRAAYIPKGGEIPFSLPDLPPRVFSAKDRNTIVDLTKNEINKWIQKGHCHKDFFTILDDLVDFCYLLREPENHMKVASGQYVEKPVHVRQVHDMSDEMTQELTKLPRYQAYTKIIDESQRKQVVRTHRIQTHSLPEITNANMEEQALINGHTLAKHRDEIDAEIRERQNRWSRGGSPPPARRIRD